MLRSILLLVVASLAWGCDNSTEPPPQGGDEIVRTIDDLNYVHGKFFFVVRPARTLADGGVVDFSTLKVWFDDVNGSNNQGVLAGYGYADATAPAASAKLPGDFDQLQPLADYTVTTSMYGDKFPVLELANPISPSQVLGVSYEEVLPGGTRRTVGGIRNTLDTLDVQLLQVPKDVLLANAANTNYYETDASISPFYPVREHELRNVYDLLATNIDPATFTLEVRRYNANLVDSNDAVVDGADTVRYLRILGIDLFTDNGAGSPSLGPDQVVDRFTSANFVDFDRGLVYFPDLRPFDPRIATRPDATAEEDLFFKSRVPSVDPSIPGLRRLIFWPQGLANPPGYGSSSTTPQGLVSNPNVYDKRIFQPTADRRYYLLATITIPLFATTTGGR